MLELDAAAGIFSELELAMGRRHRDISFNMILVATGRRPAMLVQKYDYLEKGLYHQLRKQLYRRGSGLQLKIEVTEEGVLVYHEGVDQEGVQRALGSRFHMGRLLGYHDPLAEGMEPRGYRLIYSLGSRPFLVELCRSNRLEAGAEEFFAKTCRFGEVAAQLGLRVNMEVDWTCLQK